MSLKATQMKALSSLTQEAAPRVFSPAQAYEFFQQNAIVISRQSVTQLLPTWCQLGLIQKVKHGVYLNLRATPQPLLEEAAPMVRAGAIVSLQTVLGRAGVLNNPTDWVTCVYPYSKNPNHLELELEGGTFRFSPINDQAFPKEGDDWFDDAYEPFTQTPTATPEKALLDWVYLGTHGYRSTLPPAHDIDWDELDADRLNRLAEKMNLTKELAKFKNAVEQAETVATTTPRSYKP